MELALLQADVRTSAQVAEILAEDFVEFGSSGRVYTRDQVLSALNAETPVVMDASDFKVTALGQDVALVTYQVQKHSQPPIFSLRSSVWKLVKDRWQMVFHQGTIIL
jgi:hypothetical protein